MEPAVGELVEKLADALAALEAGKVAQKLEGGVKAEAIAALTRQLATAEEQRAATEKEHLSVIRSAAATAEELVVAKVACPHNR